MTTHMVQEPETDQLPIIEAPVFCIEDDEIDFIAVRLWRRGSWLEPTDDECSFCKGEAQRCLALCQ